MSHRRLEEINNPQTRVAEFEFRMREGSVAQRRCAVLEAMGDQYPPLRHQAGQVAGELADDLALSGVLCALAVGDVDAAVERAAELGLAAQLVPAPHAAVRQIACLGLRASAAPCAIAALLQAGSDDEADVRYQALVSLHALNAQSHEFRALIEQRVHDADPEVAVVAAQVTAQRAWVALGPALLGRWQEFTGSDKFQMALCLGELVARAGLQLDAARMDALIEQFLEALNHDLTAPSAIMMLQQLRVERAREPLERLAAGWFGHPLLKVEAAGALYLLDGEAGKTHLQKFLKSPRKDARGYALRLVGRLKIGALFNELTYVARSPEYHADTAVLALADFGGEDARQVLADVALNHVDHEVRTLASQQLKTMSF